MLTLITLKEDTYREETFTNLKCLFSQKISIIDSQKLFSENLNFHLTKSNPYEKRVVWFIEYQSYKIVTKSTIIKCNITVILFSASYRGNKRFLKVNISQIQFHTFREF